METGKPVSATVGKMSLCIWFSGFFAGISVAPGFALLLPTASGGEAESGDVLQWGYITSASTHSKGRVDPGQVSNASSRPLPIGKLLDKPGNSRAAFPRKEDIVKSNSDSVSWPELYLRRPAGSSVLFSVLPDVKRRKVTWRFLNHEYELIVLEHVSYSNIVSFNSYFRHRVKYDLKTGSLLLKNVQVEDSGLFEVKLNVLLITNSIQLKYVHFHLEVQAHLQTPLIFQSPVYVLDRVQLSCIVQTGKVTNIQWLKDDVPIHNHSHYRVALDGFTLFIEDLKPADCGFYTCSVNNDVSKAKISHFLTANGVLSIVFYAFLMSAVAVVSNATSLITAMMIIFVVLRNTQDHCCVMYLLGPLSVLVSSLLLYKSAHIAVQCRYSNELLIVRGILAGLIYIFPVLVFALLYSMRILLELEPQVKLKRVRRAR